MRVSLKNLLLLKHEYPGASTSPHSHLDFVNRKQIEDLAEQDIYRYGDFCWVDFQHESALEIMDPQEIAELLYLGRMHKPLASPFFDKLKNRFAYCSHDDGWRCRLYFREPLDFVHVITDTVISAISKRRKISPFTDEAKMNLLRLTKDGLVLDFRNVHKDQRAISIPIFTIGKLYDMDDMYNNLNGYIERANYKGWLVHAERNWFID